MIFKGLVLSVTLVTIAFGLSATSANARSKRTPVKIPIARVPTFSGAANSQFYDSWVAEHLAREGCNASVSTDDNDFDGLSNLEEYAFDFSPCIGQASPSTQILDLAQPFTSTGVTYDRLLWAHLNLHAQDLGFRLLESSSLSDWHEGTETRAWPCPDQVTALGANRCYLLPAITPTRPRAFYRFQINFVNELKVAAFGDYGVDTANELAVSQLVKNVLKPDFIVTLGDNNYSLGSATTIEANIGKYYGEYILTHPGRDPLFPWNRFFSTIGNHDWYGSASVSNPVPQPYLDYFHLPYKETYYSHRFGPVEFFSIDSQVESGRPSEPDGTSPTGVQGQYINQEMQRSQALWKIPAYHHPAYTTTTSHADSQWMQAWSPYFTDNDVRLVLTGHNHHFETLAVPGLESILHVVAGSAGAPLNNTTGARHAGSQYFNGWDYGASLLTFNRWKQLSIVFHPVVTSTAKIGSASLLDQSGAQRSDLIARGSLWKYRDTGSTPEGGDWKSLAYDDSAWSSGLAPLGYGDAPTTVLSYGPNSNNKYVTTYFRRSFTVSDLNRLNQKVLLEFQRDDGAVVYLNGSEIARDNMPLGAVIGNSTLSPVTVDNHNETNFVGLILDKSQLRNGTNVLAVEIHQSSVSSSDIRFDANLTAFLFP